MGSYELVALVVDFFNHLNMLYGTVTEFCTPQEVHALLFFRTLNT